MKKIFLFTALVAAIAIACDKTENEPIQKSVEPDSGVKMITEKVSAKVNPSSKADIDADAKFTWSAGDQLAVHVSDGNYYTTETLASGGSNSATFSVTYPDGQSRDAFAIYPASIVASDAANYGQSGASLNVTLPSSYTLDQVSGTATPCPMIATNSPGNGWEFKQLCGLLRLTVKGIPSDAVGIIIQFPGNKVNGPFSITSPVSIDSPISTDNPATGQDKITITFDAGITEATVNIPLPTGIYEDVYIIPFGSSTKVAAVRHIKAGGYTAAKAHARKLTTTMVAFSVSASKKVVFAPGNLQATYTPGSPGTWTWSFAAHQYDYLGNTDGNTKVNGNGWLSSKGTVDLFGFSTESNFFGIKNSYEVLDYTGTFKDWGENTIGKYNANEWSTLSESEWQYVISEDGGRVFVASVPEGNPTSLEKAIFSKAVVAGKKGLIIFPDNYSGFSPSGVAWSYSFVSLGNMKNSNNSGWGTTISSSDWEELEAEGCVFLPVTGLRTGQYGAYNIDGGYTGMDDPTGYYIASTPESGDIRTLRINGKEESDLHGVDPNQSVNRGLGCAVRLVHEITSAGKEGYKPVAW